VFDPTAMASKRILVPGIGNIFFGDDAFGCEVVSQLLQRHALKRVTSPK
jgi:Ni,Fe-hydrogenase maturation factor